jgi:hypothetical protein
MNISFHQTLKEALDSLKRGEVLYTNSWFILNPIRIWYKKHTRWYKKRSGEYEQTQYVPIVIEEEKLSISDKLRLEGKKKQDRDGPTQERGLYAVKEGEKEKIAEDVKDLYSYYCLRKEEIEELIEDLISSSEKNKGLFKEPLRKAIDLGLGEVKDKIKDKDLILVGIMPSDFFGQAKELEVLDHLMEHLRNPVLMALEEEKWKKDFSKDFEEFWEMNLLDIARRVEDIIRERIRYVNETEKRRHGLYGDEETYFWHKVIEVADKELGLGKGRITGDVWEKGRILGLEFGGIRKLEDHVYEAKKKLEKMGRNYAEEVFPEALGDIRILLPATPKPENSEVVIVPYGIRDKNKSGDKEIDLLTLIKVEVKEVEFEFSQTCTKEAREGVSIWTFPQHYMRVIRKEEVPKEFEEGKGKVLIKPRYSESIEILNMQVSQKRGVETELKSMKKQALLRSVEYVAETEGLNKSLVIDVESVNQPSIVVKDYYQLKEGKSINEEITIETFFSKSISPNIEREKGTGCLGGDIDKIIKEELENLAAEIKEYAEKETRKEEKASLESASLVAKRASEALGRGNISQVKCIKYDKSESYRYEITPKPVEGYEPIIEDKEIVETFKGCCKPLMIRKYEILFNLFGHKEVEKLCFESEGTRAKIGIEEIDRVIGGEGKKETIYIRKFSEELSNLFVDYVNKVTSENPQSEYKYDIGIEKEVLARMPNKKGEIREANNLSLLLSGLIASSMLIPWEEKFPLMKGKKEEAMIRMVGKLYKVILIVLTGGAYEYVEKNAYWPKVQIFWLRSVENKSMINEKELLKEMLGVVIKIKVTEGVKVFIPEYGGKRRSGLERTSLKIDYDIELLEYEENPIIFYLETGKEGKVLEIRPYIYTEYS